MVISKNLVEVVTLSGKCNILTIKKGGKSCVGNLKK